MGPRGHGLVVLCEAVGECVDGDRIALHVGTPQAFQAPPYVAHLVWTGSRLADRATLEMREMVRANRIPSNKATTTLACL